MLILMKGNKNFEILSDSITKPECMMLSIPACLY
jgi:hypothetical protein